MMANMMRYDRVDNDEVILKNENDNHQ